MKKRRRKREKVGLPKKLQASQQLLTHRRVHTHTPDLRFTLNTQRKRQVFLFTSRWTSLSVSLPLSHLTMTSAVLSLLSLARPLSLSHSDYCFLVFSSREWAEQQSDVLPSHVLFVCSHSSSANGVHSPARPFSPLLLFCLSLFHSHNQLITQSSCWPLASFPLLNSSFLQCHLSIPVISFSPAALLSVPLHLCYIFLSRRSIFISTLVPFAILIKTLLSITPIFHPCDIPFYFN